MENIRGQPSRLPKDCKINQVRNCAYFIRIKMKFHTRYLMSEIRKTPQWNHRGERARQWNKK